VSGDPKDKGGFIYAPGSSKTETTGTDGKKTLHSYGSMSYAGLLSYIYADVKKDDPRVLAVVDWLQNHYTLEENPGMGPEGLYYYYCMMAKALSAYGIPELKLADGRKIDWRKEMALKLINLQKPDGSWSNENGRWMEKDPTLVSSYSLLALELLHRSL
jgi:squalene-hopene/tetraprenyl-beta-curcumene cyclase